MNKRGFTLIELVLTITVLGLLAVAVLPYVRDISANARRSSRDGISGALRSSINMSYSNSLATGAGKYPATLDPVAPGSACNSATPCFGAVLRDPVKDGSAVVGWRTGAAANTYVYSDGSGTWSYTYNNATGSFAAPGAP